MAYRVVRLFWLRGFGLTNKVFDCILCLLYFFILIVILLYLLYIRKIVICVS